MKNMKEIEFEFEDGSTYTIRQEKVGDTIMGKYAHDIMFAMQKHFNYAEPNWRLKVEFILGYENNNKVK